MHMHVHNICNIFKYIHKLYKKITLKRIVNERIKKYFYSTLYIIHYIFTYYVAYYNNITICYIHSSLALSMGPSQEPYLAVPCF